MNVWGRMTELRAFLRDSVHCQAALSSFTVQRYHFLLYQSGRNRQVQGEAGSRAEGLSSRRNGRGNRESGARVSSARQSQGDRFPGELGGRKREMGRGA